MFAHGRHEAARRASSRVTGSPTIRPREGMNEGGGAARSPPSARRCRATRRSARCFSGVTGWYRRMRWLDATPADIYPTARQTVLRQRQAALGHVFPQVAVQDRWRDFALVAERWASARIQFAIASSFRSEP